MNRKQWRWMLFWLFVINTFIVAMLISIERLPGKAIWIPLGISTTWAAWVEYSNRRG